MLTLRTGYGLKPSGTKLELDLYNLQSSLLFRKFAFELDNFGSSTSQPPVNKLSLFSHVKNERNAALAPIITCNINETLDSMRLSEKKYIEKFTAIFIGALIRRTFVP